MDISLFGQKGTYIKLLLLSSSLLLLNISPYSTVPLERV